MFECLWNFFGCKCCRPTRVNPIISHGPLSGLLVALDLDETLFIETADGRYNLRNPHILRAILHWIVKNGGQLAIITHGSFRHPERREMVDELLQGHFYTSDSIPFVDINDVCHLAGSGFYTRLTGKFERFLAAKDLDKSSQRAHRTGDICKFNMIQYLLFSKHPHLQHSIDKVILVDDSAHVIAQVNAANQHESKPEGLVPVETIHAQHFWGDTFQIAPSGFSYRAELIYSPDEQDEFADKEDSYLIRLAKEVGLDEQVNRGEPLTAEEETYRSFIWDPAEGLSIIRTA